ncbi:MULTISPECIES: restriction endonuclease [unclassified Yoonia]|uniref:restriction endonuclease n=1 Tax=unclassified Yoonia TaxID=2629118 RepID=UPI002AFFC6DA|nr:MULTISPECIES: restriction endonuclease [unclassified Yoonia]
MENFVWFIGSIFAAIVAKGLGALGLFPGLAGFVFWTALVFGGIFLILSCIAFIKWARPRTEVNLFEQALLNVIQKDVAVLARKKFQLSSKNDYGVVDQGRWFSEWDNYWRFILPGKCLSAGVPLSPSYRDILGEYPDRSKHVLGRAIHQMIEGAVAELKNTSRDLEGITPLGFEVLCVEKLAEAGWDARTTKNSGDQGADIVATFEDETLVVQCKLYGRPVGNKAVQEIAAARDHYRADYAAVVTNSTFTRAANDLAASTGVKLVTYVDVASALSPERVHAAD